MRRVPPRVENEFDSNNFGFICDGVSNVEGYLTKMPHTMCPLQFCNLSTITAVVGGRVEFGKSQKWIHTPSIAFRHLPPNSARFGYDTEGALFISAQLSTDAVSALPKVGVLI